LTLWQLGRHDEALASYRAAMRLDPSNREILAAMERLGGR
jgi:cytochrome c-type biogenesis protein CcmH/NrfG